MRFRVLELVVRTSACAFALVASPAWAGPIAIFSDGFETGFPCAWSTVVPTPPGLCLGPFTIDFCRLQFPLVIQQSAGTGVDVFGRVYIAGLTDQSPLNDPAPELVGYLGFGPDGSDPALGGWSWEVATPNPGWDGSTTGEPNNDEYRGNLLVPGPPGPYDFAFAFSGDSGVTFTYCDGGSGSANGYSPAEAGQMTSQ